MQRRLELLAPGGDIDSIKAAIVAGADAIYCGLGRLNARIRATNITVEELGGILALAHGHDCKVYLTLNIMMVESDLRVVIGLLNKLVNTSIDGVIVQDLGVLFLLSRYYPSLEIHASTQLTTHNEGQIEFLGRLGAARVNLARELDIHEIEALATAGRRENVSTEVFVHGSYCLSFSGICYLSSRHGLSSGNRGCCSQPCRDRYRTTRAGQDYPLNLEDNSAFSVLKELADAGVDALKIEGRIKKFPYVYTVTRAWRRQLERLYEQVPLEADDPDLEAVFNRGFSSGYLLGDVSRDMYCDTPRNQSAQRLRDRAGRGREGTEIRPIEEAYDEIAEIAAHARKEIDRVSTEKTPLRLRMSGEAGTPLRVDVETPGASFSVSSELLLAPRSNTSTSPPLNVELFLERLKAVHDTEYRIEQLEADQLQPSLFLPFREISSIKRRILFVLNGSREPIAPIDPIDLSPTHRPTTEESPSLAVLVSSERDLYLGRETNAEMFFQLPSCLGERLPAYVELFSNDSTITPWFPSVLIGEDYRAAVELLRLARPVRLATNNSGIAHEASKAGIRWIAGPQMNVSNSLAMRCLKETFHCAGAFLSHELGMFQIKRIEPPPDFELYYGIYHPMLLLTTRQCLFHQITGCEKNSIDTSCLPRCEKTAILSTLDSDSFVVKKTKGNYPSLFSDRHFMNTDIVSDIPGLFSGFLVDLTDIETDTRVKVDKAGVIALFESHLQGHPHAATALEGAITPTSREPYIKGV